MNPMKEVVKSRDVIGGKDNYVMTGKENQVMLSKDNIIVLVQALEEASSSLLLGQREGTVAVPGPVRKCYR